jgi:MFS superfamily sulfate permease-like transporter
MTPKRPVYYLQHPHEDIPAGIVVFLVALPLCLGIALASGAPLLSGVVTGIVGGLVVSWASGSQLSISGPAAGLAVIALHAIETLGGYPVFLLSVMLAGVLQIALGMLRAGVISAYFPAAVIKGMLAAIGLILMLKQIPHALGYDADFEGDEAFLQSDDHTTLSELVFSLQAFSPVGTIVGVAAIGIMLLGESKAIKIRRWLALVPGPLVAVAWSIAWNLISREHLPDLTLEASHLVNLPVINGVAEFTKQLVWPDFSQWSNPGIYRVAVTLAIIASLETLLNLEAVDKLDPLKRVAPTNHELKAQGLGNLVSGLLGGLPMTALIVRSSANITAGGKTKVASFVHGLMLLVSALFLSPYLNLIPLAALAAILLLTGYRLCQPALFRDMYRKGASQIVPFLVTIGAILFTDLLTGMAIGLVFGLYYVVRTNFHSAVSLTRDGRHYLLRLQNDASFLNKAPLRQALSQIEDGSYVIIDGTRARFIDHDIIETIEDFMAGANDSQIRIELKNLAGLSPKLQAEPST